MLLLASAHSYILNFLHQNLSYLYVCNFAFFIRTQFYMANTMEAMNIAAFVSLFDIYARTVSSFSFAVFTAQF